MGLKAIIVVPSFQPPVNVTSTGTTIGVAQSGITIYLFNRAAATTFNLPASPVQNQIIICQDSGNNFSTYPLTISGNGNNINVPNLGAESSVPINGNGEDMWLNWNGAAWGVLA